MTSPLAGLGQARVTQMLVSNQYLLELRLHSSIINRKQELPEPNALQSARYRFPIAFLSKISAAFSLDRSHLSGTAPQIWKVGGKLPLGLKLAAHSSGFSSSRGF